MKEIMIMERNGVKVNIHGKMEVVFMEIGETIKSQDMEFTFGQIIVDTKVNGRTIKCMGRVFMFGLMVEDMKGRGWAGLP